MHRSTVLPVIATLAVAASASAGVGTSWISWSAPASYDSTANVTPWGAAGDYTYASTATGTITMPDQSQVTATLSGEVVNPTSWSSWAGASSIYGAPSGFASVAGTTTADFWSTRPATDANTFNSANATAPTNGDHIGVIGYGTLTQTITFSAPVTNIVMSIYSMGSSSVPASWDFNQNFDILSDNDGASNHGYVGSGLDKTLANGIYRLSGSEGSGMIQFFGTFTELTWTVSAPEAWATWNIGATPVSAPSQNAVPGAGGVAALAGLGLAGRRRRR